MLWVAPTPRYSGTLVHYYPPLQWYVSPLNSLNVVFNTLRHLYGRTHLLTETTHKTENVSSNGKVSV